MTPTVSGRLVKMEVASWSSSRVVDFTPLGVLGDLSLGLYVSPSSPPVVGRGVSVEGCLVPGRGGDDIN